LEDGADVRVFVRSRDRAQRWGGRVQVAAGDLDEPATIERAVDGVESLFMLGLSESQDAALVRSAVEAQVRRVVMLSSGGVPYGVASGAMHKAGEDLLRGSGLDWTILHPYEFMSNALFWAPSINGGGVVVDCSGDGRHALIDPLDIAAAAAAVLTGEGHQGQTYLLTGPQAITRAEMAAEIGRQSGREVRHQDVPGPAYRDMVSSFGMPPDMVDPLISFLLMVRAGELDQVSPEVERLTGRPPRTFPDWLAENVAAFSS
ncbi:MAG: NAD(P)H-binding protein, partial [Candidatus Dormibacteraeota bacterium]|nr:NAD(P)H-binding protein [Candidatus Dormibacteraeota bacterium]